MHALEFLHGKTVLVTGATGFIGSHLVNRLRAAKDIHLVFLSRKSVTENCKNVTWVTASLEQLSLNAWLAAGVKRIDVVLHLGAFIPKSGDAADQVEAVYRDNLLGTRFLLESFPSLPERIVFASTIDVYASSSDTIALSESSPVGPANLYGASKLFCEQLVRAYARKHRCDHAVLRYGHIFGPGEEAFQKLIPQTIRQLMRGEAPVLYGDGSAERDFLYVEDAVEATLRAAVSDTHELGPINIVGGRSRPVRDIVETLMSIVNFQGSIQYLTDKPAGLSLRFDNKRMRDGLGDWDLVSLEDGLKLEVEHFQNLRADK